MLLASRSFPSNSNPLESPCVYSLNRVKRVYTLDTLEPFFKLQNPFPMDMTMRRQLIADLLTSSFDFDLLTSTAEWEELTCDEQMTLADLIDS